MSDPHQIAREKALYRYSRALGQGDFAVVSEVLAQAEEDAVLEEMILELNKAQIMAENPATSFDFGNAREKRPSTSLGRTFNWLNIHQYFMRRRAFIGGGVLVGILVLFVLASNLTMRGSPEVIIETVIETVAEQSLPTLAAQATVAPLARQSNDFLSLSSSDSNSEDLSFVQATSVPESTVSLTTAAQPEPETRLIVRNGTIEVNVENTFVVKQAIEDRVAEMSSEGAFVIFSNESGRRNNLPAVNIAIRVPATRFDDMMDWLADQAAEGTVAARSETADDVTAEYIDLAARAQSLQAARDRLLELMQNAETTEELLLAEQQLTQREAEIESLQGRLQYLSQAAQLSRIDITLTPYILSQPPDVRWRPAETTRRAYDSLLNSGRDFLDFLIIFAIAILPWLIAAGLFLTLIYRFIWRPLRARRQ
jgi:hypothetical protein